ncbi:condensation domain-containing protein [Amycolatopsis sp. PS_44_ISF1]|uniref:condensation domain-containing protein n=1 Tax=Amycolatopsis sp. PS_44_ISF1 TaxID=2974917 RepID=UPI0028DEFF9F|nr:condensation domain-containing protein [Amycolatopsis sp. PS_44_ISF1]MDT8912287.1 condensation domain-containing protein [Amycolatopsis sp. PS_44_ISF1]
MSDATRPVPPRRGPLTETQRQMWALDQREPDPGALNLSYALAVDGPLDVVALGEAFRSLVRTHEPLRTIYFAEGDDVVAEVVPAEVAPAAVELAPCLVGETEAVRLIREDRSRPFDLATETPIRARLLRLGPDRHILLVSVHHIAGDGWSIFVLRQHLTRSYAALKRGDRPDPGVPRVECLELARSQLEWTRGPAVEPELSWWTDRLRGATARPALLGDHRQPGEIRRQVEALPGALTTELTTLAKQAGTSLFVVLLTAFEVLIERWSGCANVVIGTLAANRPTADSAAVLGAHYNPLLLNTDLSGDPSLAECLLRTAERTLAALDRQRLPFAVLAERVKREFGWAAVPGVVFQMDRYPMEGLALTGCTVTGLYVDDGCEVSTIPAATSAGLTFFVRETGARLTLSVLYSGDSFDDGSIRAAMDAYVEVLAALCDAPELPVPDLVLPGPAPAPAREAAGGSPGRLREMGEIGPVDALSPVGVWHHPHQQGGAA